MAPYVNYVGCILGAVTQQEQTIDYNETNNIKMGERQNAESIPKAARKTTELREINVSTG